MFFVAIFGIVTGYGVYTSQGQTNLTDLALDNVEALANNNEYDQKIWERYYREDNTGYNCTKGGSETC